MADGTIHNQISDQYLQQFNRSIGVSGMQKLQSFPELQLLGYNGQLSFMKNDFHGLQDFKTQLSTYSSVSATLRAAWSLIKYIVPNNMSIQNLLFSSPGLGVVGKAFQSIHGFGQVFSLSPNDLTSPSAVSTKAAVYKDQSSQASVITQNTAAQAIGGVGGGQVISFNATEISGVQIIGTPSLTNNILVYNGTNLVWAPEPSGGGGGSSVTTRGDRKVILQNPDFEGSTTNPPPGWSLQGGTFSYEIASPAPGKVQSAKLSTTTSGQGLRQGFFSVVPGEVYYISAAVKSDGTGIALVGLQGINGAFTTFTTYASSSSTSTGWTTLTATGIVPAGSIAMQLILINNSNTASSVWFDDVVVQKISVPNNVPLYWMDETGTARIVLNTASDGSISLGGYHGNTALTTVNGATYLFAGDSSSTPVVALQIAGARVGSGQILGWASATNPIGNLQDTGLSRISAGIVAIGNGTQGNLTGTLQLSTINNPAGNLNLSSGGTIVANANVQRTQIGSGTGNGQTWGLSIQNAGNTDLYSLFASSTTYTTGGTLGWVPNSAAYFYHSSQPFLIGATTAATTAVAFDGTGKNMSFSNLGTLQWSNGHPTTGTIDTGLSRTAAGIIAVGNGTASDASGTIISAVSKEASIVITTRGDRRMLLFNPDFEGSSIIPPPGWTNSGTASYETTSPAPGKLQSIKLATTLQFQALSYATKFSVVPGEVYAITGVTKSDGTGGSAHIEIAFQDKNATFISQGGTSSNTTSTWTAVSGLAIVPANAVQAVIALENNSATQPSTVWFDQIGLQKLDHIDGTSTIPAFTFSSENVMGLYRGAPGTLQTSGSQVIQGSLRFVGVPQVGTPTVTPTNGATSTWTYVIVAVDDVGNSFGTNVGAGTANASNPGSTTTGAATLDGTHFNTISWAAATGASYYRVYRTAVGTSPNTTGLIGTVNSPTLIFVDNGLAGDGTVAPTVNTTGWIRSGVLMGSAVNGLPTTAAPAMLELFGSGSPPYPYNEAGSLAICSRLGGATRDILFATGNPGVYQWLISRNGPLIGNSGNPIAWYSSTIFNNSGANTPVVPDTGLSRLQAGAVAVGNGSQGDFSATVKAAMYQSAGTSFTPSGNIGVFNYDTVGGQLSVAAQSPSGTTNIAFYTSNGANSLVRVNITNTGVTSFGPNPIGWNASGPLSANDVGISRHAAASIFIGNGTNGDRTGTVGAAAYTDDGSGNFFRFTASSGIEAELWNSGVFSWSSTNRADGTRDTGLSRLGPGVIGVGTGASGSTAGNLEATELIGLGTGGGNSSAIQYVAGGSGGVGWRDTSQGTDLKQWDLLTVSGQFLGRVVNDANSSASTWLTVTRSGATATGVQFSPNINSTRINPRTTTVADATSITPPSDTADVVIQSNSQAAGTLTINAPTGTPTDGQKFILRIKTTNAQNYSFNAIYHFSTSVTAPTSIAAGKTDYIGCMWNATNSAWDVIATDQGH